MTRLLASILFLISWTTAALAAPAGSATYTVTFDATWSAATHPASFPPSPHFSGLVGGVHHAGVDFWQAGQPASLGIKHMAEWGSQETLLAEVGAAVTAGTAAGVLAGDVLWVSPGQTSLTVVVTPEHSLVTLVTMIAPSPDWFAGVDGLDLSNGAAWRENVVVPLDPFDAGTDSGTDYTSPDLATTPPGVITAISGGPFSSGVPVGTLTFQLDTVSAAPLPQAGWNLTAQPNPFNPGTTIKMTVPRDAGFVNLEVFDARGTRIRQLWQGTPATGIAEVFWDGRDDSGRGASSGLYLVRLRGNGFQTHRKLTLVK